MNHERDPEGLRVARRLSAWHLGHPDWADTLIMAYLNPKEAEATLRAEQSEIDEQVDAIIHDFPCKESR